MQPPSGDPRDLDYGHADGTARVPPAGILS